MSCCFAYVITFALQVQQLITGQCDHNIIHPDSWKICQIFKNAPMENNIHWWNTSKTNYCDWVSNDASISNEFDCDGNNITKLDLDETPYCIQPYSTINTTIGWPKHIQHIDLDQYPSCSGGFGGEWDWSQISSLQDLKSLDLEFHSFYGDMDNTVWNMLLNLPHINELDLRRNNFSCNFSKIALNTNSNLKYLFISYVTEFYGTISIDNFLSKFPKMASLSIRGNNFEAHFDNLDFLTSMRMPNLVKIQIDSNAFTGSIKLSQGLSLSNTITTIRLDNNDFSYIDWNIFSNLQSLQILVVGPLVNLNAVSIDWNIIGGLSFLSLITFDAKGVEWAGYADFSQLSETITVSLIVDYLCNPTIYLCPSGQSTVSRTAVSCTGKANCVATCRCSDDSIPITLSPNTATPTSNMPTTIPPTTVAPSVTTDSPTQTRTTYSAIFISPTTTAPSTDKPVYDQIINAVSTSDVDHTNVGQELPGNNKTNSNIFIVIGIICIVIGLIVCVIMIKVIDIKIKSDIVSNSNVDSELVNNIQTAANIIKQELTPYGPTEDEYQNKNIQQDEFIINGDDEHQTKGYIDYIQNDISVESEGELTTNTEGNINSSTTTK